MATLTAALLALLTEGSPAPVTGPVFAGKASQGTRAPFTIYQQRDREGFADSLDGPAELAQKLMQVDSYGNSYAVARSNADKIRRKFHATRGLVDVGSASPRETVDIRAMRLIDEIDFGENDVDPSEYRIMQQYLITFIEV